MDIVGHAGGVVRGETQFAQGQAAPWSLIAFPSLIPKRESNTG